MGYLGIQYLFLGTTWESCCIGKCKKIFGCRRKICSTRSVATFCNSCGPLGCRYIRIIYYFSCLLFSLLHLTMFFLLIMEGVHFKALSMVLLFYFLCLFLIPCLPTSFPNSLSLLHFSISLLSYFTSLA